MTPKAFVALMPDTDLREIVRDILAWQANGTRQPNDAIDRLIGFLVTDCNLPNDSYILSIAESLALHEAAKRFSEQRR